VSESSPAWVKEFPGSITVCDRAGVIVEMNDGAVKAFAKQGGIALLGTNVLDCHPEPSRTKLRELLATGKVNVYTVESRGVRRLICQAPWHEDGQLRGLVEISLVLPDDVPHFVRDGL